MTIKFKDGQTFEALKWNDNISKMKRFCGDCCIITYETCSVDDYWLLKVFDVLKDGEKTTVALGNYVVKLDDESFTVVDNIDFDRFFEEYRGDDDKQPAWYEEILHYAELIEHIANEYSLWTKNDAGGCSDCRAILKDIAPIKELIVRNYYENDITKLNDFKLDD